jgi:hypothetical protein
MKKFLTLLSLCVLLSTTGVNAAFAEDESDFHVIVGAKAWMNTWTTSFYSTDNTFSGSNIISTTSSGTTALIPSLSLKFGNWNLSTGYMPETDYSWASYTQFVKWNSTTPRLLYSKWAAKRGELDVNLGYSVAPGLTLSAGYKQIIQKYSSQAWYSDALTTIYKSTGDTTISGPTLGVAVNAPISGQWSAYGNFAYGSLTATYSGSSTSDTGVYYSSEVGVVYAFSGAAVTLGYKNQIVETAVNTPTGSQTAPDVTKGFILGAILSF